MQDIITGTEKQNKWAEDIRSDLVDTLEEQLAQFKAHPQCPEEYKNLTLDQWLSMAGPVYSQLRKILEVENHRFWIDVVHGNTGSRAGIQNLMAAPKLVQYV